jgi:hypothetical protein
MSTTELVKAVGRQGLGTSEAKLAAVLQESEAGGLVERCDGGWRLTDRAERRYGQHLRNLSLGIDEAVAT